MRIHYSTEADALYIRLKEDPVADTDAVSDDIIFDYNREGNVIAIEVLSASLKADIREIVIQAFDRVMVEPPVPAQ
jgi:uncharacterized protein YuzE